MHGLEISVILERQKQYKIQGSIFNDAHICSHITVHWHMAPCQFLCYQGLSISNKYQFAKGSYSYRIARIWHYQEVTMTSPKCGMSN
jgi:hypothetical protein